jgi:hypothetical protein
MSSGIPTVLLDFVKDLNTNTRKKQTTLVAVKSLQFLNEQLDNLKTNPGAYGLSSARANALERNLIRSRAAINVNRDSINIKLKLKDSAESDPSSVSEWAAMINRGHTVKGMRSILPTERKMLAVPFTIGGDEIVSFARGSRDPHIVGKFVSQHVEKSSSGKPMLYYLPRGDHLVMMGKIMGGKWEGIATLFQSIPIKQAPWADEILYNVAKALGAKV